MASSEVDRAIAAQDQSTGQIFSFTRFKRLREAVSEQFHRFPCHIFIMATGIVVRMLAPLIIDKTRDPAVVVIDDQGKNCISLLSGHLGGANQLALSAAQCIGANPVITTATDVNRVPAIDVLANDAGLVIENPKAIKYVNKAFLSGSPILFEDRYNFLLHRIPEQYIGTPGESGSQSRVIVDCHISQHHPQALLLRPQILVAGMGCNRNTDMEEMLDLLLLTLEKNNLSRLSLCRIASVDIKCDEQGLLDLASELSLPLEFYTREQLKAVDTIQTPSAMVEKHIGVPSVCEAAAILGAQQGHLIVPKVNTKNVTVAIASQCSI